MTLPRGEDGYSGRTQDSADSGASAASGASGGTTGSARVGFPIAAGLASGRRYPQNSSFGLRRGTVASDADDIFADSAEGGEASGLNYVTVGRATRMVAPAKGKQVVTPRLSEGDDDDDEDDDGGNDDDAAVGLKSQRPPNELLPHGFVPGSESARSLPHRMSLRTYDASARLQPSLRHGRSSLAMAAPLMREDEADDDADDTREDGGSGSRTFKLTY